MDKLDNVICFNKHRFGKSCMEQLFLPDHQWCELCKVDFHNYVVDMSTPKIGVFSIVGDEEVPF